MKKIILILGLVVILGGGGFAGWYFFMRPGKDAKAEKKKPVEEKVIFHEMSPFLVNLADPGGKRYLKVTMRFEITNTDVDKELNDKVYEVRDAVLMFLSSLEVDDIALPAGKMTLKRELITRINRMLKTGKIRHIYFTEFLIQ